LAELDVNGVRVQFVDEGSGMPVVLLHGGISSSRQWRPLIDRLCGRYRLLAPDFVGHGGTSPWTGERPFGFSEEWRLVEAMIDRAGGPVHLVGHSYGGWIAIDGALGVPDRIRSLSLIEPSVFHLLRHGSDAEAWSEAKMLRDKLVDLVNGGNAERFARWFMGYWIAPGAWEALPEEGRARVRSLLPVHAMGALSIFGREKALDDYARIDMPTLLVRGTRTVPPSRAVVDLLARTIPGVRLAEIDGAGHTSPVTHGDAVNTAIEAHLERCESGIAA
jgi:pimeloyl-ACP methyl ester carboxylesterase